MSSVPQGNVVDPAMVSCDQHLHVVMELVGLRDYVIRVFFMFLTTMLLEDNLIVEVEKHLMTNSSSSTRKTIKRLLSGEASWKY